MNDDQSHEWGDLKIKRPVKVIASWNNCWLSDNERLSRRAVNKAKFIHSFIHIEHLYSASSRELLRDAPDSSTAKKSSLKVRKNAGDKALGKIRSWEGSQFQIEGPTTEKARLCLVEVRANGTRAGQAVRWKSSVPVLSFVAASLAPHWAAFPVEPRWVRASADGYQAQWKESVN